MQKYDYIITGTGASGLMLAYHMMCDTFFDQKQILLIDKEIKNQNDRTWCYWEKDTGIWDSIVYKKWKNIFFGSVDFSRTIDISPYQYKCIRSKDFYEFVFAMIHQKSNITVIQERVMGLVDEGTIVEVETDKQMYLGDKVFTSVLLDSAYKTQQKYPVLNQHFIGWFVKTEIPSFDTKTATFMDFDLEQHGNTRFMYILPFSETEALFEYTLFSKDLLEKQVYEDAIIKYLDATGIKEYEVTEKERGCIPMTCYDFGKQNSRNILHIGTAGGWTKPTTGFTFHKSQKKVTTLIQFLKKDPDLSYFEKRSKFWYYDVLFLDVLSKENQHGAALFSRLFRKNKTTTILQFLDEETSFFQDLKIMASMPAGTFLKMIVRRLLG